VGEDRASATRSTRVKGEVVNIMNYGAFVKLEDGIEGLVHISEMSWTRRINHPSEMVNAGDEVEVVVLDIDKDKQEISLGMKQTEVNPWTLVAEKYPPAPVIEGVVRNLDQLRRVRRDREGIDGLLHVSDMSWTKKVSTRQRDAQEGRRGRVRRARGRPGEAARLAWAQAADRGSVGRAVPEPTSPGMVVRARSPRSPTSASSSSSSRISKGLLHVSELADHKVENPQDEVKAGEEIDVKILRVDTTSARSACRSTRPPC
jgi:small subunit ribosomal protein S1